MTHKLLYPAALIAGALALLWVGAGYAVGHPLALAVTLLVAAFYAMGAVELHRFRRATRALATAVAAVDGQPPASLPEWLATVPAGLRQAVRLRVAGERVALPGPSTTPYLVGLLVLLGMLGTFLGMVVTLKGTVVALEGTVDLAAMRAALAAPVRGLGLAFGTSIAGVAASAMLGLMSTLARRERMLVAQALDACLGSTLRVFSPAHQRDEAFRALQAQSALMPTLVERLATLADRLEQQGREAHEQLAARQERFHHEAGEAYRGLATAVERSLQASLAEGARLAGATLQPLVETTMDGIRRDTAAWHERVAAVATGQLADLERQAQQQAEALQRRLEEREAALRALLQAEETQRLAAWTQSLQQVAATLRQEWQQAGAQALAQQQQVGRALEATAREIGTQAQAHAQATIAEVARLMDTASEAPRAAAEVIGQLRRERDDAATRDAAMLEERSRLMAGLAGVLDTLQAQAAAQRDAVERDAGRLDALAAQLGSSAIEVASLGDAFTRGVTQFGDSSERLLAHLQRLEAALDKAGTRSDEQLAYYVAQAREVIDLTLLSQKRIVEDLHQLGRRAALPAGEAA